MSGDVGVGVLAATVILSGLVIVFLLLILLIVCVEITSRALKAGGDKSAQKPAAQAAKPVAVPVKAAAPAISVPVAPAVQQGIEEETVAVISAAVYSCMEAEAPGASYLIRSINRATGGRPVWGFAGMQQNTRPF